jgi:hypothetical protein
MARILKELFVNGKIIFYLVRGISFMFCFTLGALSTIIFSTAMIYLSKSSGEASSSSLGYLFTAVGLTTIAVVVLDLAVTVFREMVTSEGEKRHPFRVRQSLTRFMVMVIIAILIEGLIMLFKFSETDKLNALPYAILTFAGALMLIIGLGIYLKITIPVEKLIEKDSPEKSKDSAA